MLNTAWGIVDFSFSSIVKSICTHKRSHTTCMQLPLLVPSLEYSFETRVESLDEVGRTENISVFVMRKGNPVPLITALIKMPISESVIVV